MRTSKLSACVLLAATLLANVAACTRPAEGLRNEPTREPRLKQIDASGMQTFRDTLAGVTEGVGAVTETGAGYDALRVCVLEEQHTSVAGQLETALMILRLYERHGLRHIALEGLTADKSFPATAWYRQLGGPEDEETRHEVLVGLLRDGELSAAELIAVAFPDVTVRAADDPAAYAVGETQTAGMAPTAYLYKIALKSVRPEHDARLRLLSRQHKVAQLVEFVISLDGWARERYEVMKSTTRRASIEQRLRDLKEIEARAAFTGAEITAEERGAMAEARDFFEAGNRRSESMARAVRELAPEAPLVALNLGAAHTEVVGRLLADAGLTYAVMSPASLNENGGSGDIGDESFERKGKSLSVTGAGEGLGSLLDGRKKPPPVLGKTWLKADAQLRFATALIARAQLGPGFPDEGLRRKVDALDHVRVSWDSVRQVGTDKLFKASARVEQGWTDIWGQCGRPRAALIPLQRRSLEDLLIANLNLVRRGGGLRTEHTGGPVFELITHDVIAAYSNDPGTFKDIRGDGAAVRRVRGPAAGAADESQSPASASRSKLIRAVAETSGSGSSNKT
ncbi:MAG: hypothetical protein ABW208_03840 [Pyrinomonadaceae bacterium]